MDFGVTRASYNPAKRMRGRLLPHVRDDLPGMVCRPGKAPRFLLWAFLVAVAAHSYRASAQPFQELTILPGSNGSNEVTVDASATVIAGTSGFKHHGRRAHHRLSAIRRRPRRRQLQPRHLRRPAPRLVNLRKRLAQSWPARVVRRRLTKTSAEASKLR